MQHACNLNKLPPPPHPHIHVHISKLLYACDCCLACILLPYLLVRHMNSRISHVLIPHKRYKFPYFEVLTYIKGGFYVV